MMALLHGGRHGPGARIREQVDQHVIGSEPKHVVAGIVKRRHTIFTRRELDRLDRLDAEWLDDGAGVHRVILPDRALMLPSLPFLGAWMESAHGSVRPTTMPRSQTARPRVCLALLHFLELPGRIQHQFA